MALKKVPDPCCHKTKSDAFASPLPPPVSSLHPSKPSGWQTAAVGSTEVARLAIAGAVLLGEKVEDEECHSHCYHQHQENDEDHLQTGEGALVPLSTHGRGPCESRGEPVREAEGSAPR